MSENSIVDTAVYEEHYGWTPKSVLVVIGCLAFALAGIVIWSSSPVIAVIGIVFFGGGGICVLIGVLRGNLALRVDQEGVAIGRGPLQSEMPGRTVPWTDIQAVLVFTQIAGTSRVSYVALHRREGLPPLPGAPGALALRASKALIPGLPTDALATCVAINAWALNQDRLAQAITRNAPDVPLVDLRK